MYLYYFYSPDSFGYAKLPTGFAQVIERVDGRGPRYDLPADELSSFRAAQKELCRIALNLGLEQAGQIHPDNPFGMANLWFDDQKKRWVWLDTIPAIPHRGWVWPLFYFRFHQDIRHWFAQEYMTFNRIHTGYLLTEVSQKRSLFSDRDYESIKADAYLYERLWWERKEAETLKRDYGLVFDATSELAENLFTDRFVYKILADPHFRQEKLQTLARIMREPTFRAFYFDKNFILRGIERARREGIVSQEELDQAWEVVQVDQFTPAETRKQIAVLTSLQIYYLISSEIINAIEISSYFSVLFPGDRLKRAAFGFFIGWVLPSILRPLSTEIVQTLTGVELQAAKKASAFPKFGGWIAIPAQVVVTTGGPAEKIWHYTVRNIIAGLSKIFPSGGWNSQLEGELLHGRIGRMLEDLGKHS